MAEFLTFKGSWPWPWIRSYRIPSCIAHQSLPTYQILLKSKKLFVDKQMYERTYGRTLETHFIRSNRRSQPKNKNKVRFGHLLPPPARKQNESILEGIDKSQSKWVTQSKEVNKYRRKLSKQTTIYTALKSTNELRHITAPELIWGQLIKVEKQLCTSLSAIKHQTKKYWDKTPTTGNCK